MALELPTAGALAVELALVAIIGYKALQLRRSYREQLSTGVDLYDALRASARSVLGSLAGGVLAYEIAVFWYAVAGWRRSSALHERSFTVHRDTAYASLIIAAMIALVVETVAVHLLVRLWSPVAAWVLTGLSVYAMVWMFGDLHAVRLRPVEIDGETLHLRVGLRWTAAIPLDAIRAVGAPAGDRRRRTLKAVLIGAPNRRLELREPVVAAGIYGYLRRATAIELHVDEPERFDAVLERGTR